MPKKELSSLNLTVRFGGGYDARGGSCLVHIALRSSLPCACMFFACMLGGCSARACMLFCAVSFCCVLFGRFGVLVPVFSCLGLSVLSSFSFFLFLPLFLLILFLLSFLLCLSSLTLNEESTSPE